MRGNAVTRLGRIAARLSDFERIADCMITSDRRLRALLIAGDGDGKSDVVGDECKACYSGRVCQSRRSR